jgi:hypothetical protein
MRRRKVNVSTDFTRANPALERAIAECRTKEDLDAVLLRYQEANGMPTRFDRVALPSRMDDSSSQPSAPVESAGGTPQYFEVLYLHGNDRIEISAATQEEFDRRKAAVLAAYGKK